MREISGKTAVIIGMTSVLGGEIAQQLTDLGAKVIGTVRSPGQWVGTCEPAPQILTLDLLNADSIESFIEHVNDQFDRIDILVVTAGAVAFGAVPDIPADVSAQLMQVNAVAPLQIISALAPALARSGDGVVVTLSGKIAEIPTAGLAAYSASKAAIHAFSVAAGRELRRSHVNWIDARPGHTETGFATRAIFGTPPAFGPGLDPHRVAHRIVTALVTGEADLPSSAFEN